MNLKNSDYYNTWAYDLNKDPLFGGELWNEGVINQSIEMILATIFGERLFNPSFGSGLQLYIFENMTNNMALNMLQSILNSIKKWEDRITIRDSEVKLNINVDTNSILLTIPYTLNRNGIKNVFTKKINV